MDTPTIHNLKSHTVSGSNIPVISQSQPDPDSVLDEDESVNDVSSPTTGDDEIYYNLVVNYCNAVFDKTDDRLFAELKYIFDHRYINGILELKLEYTTGEVSWHSLDLAKREDLYVTVSYIISNDLGVIANGKHGRWARRFLRRLKRTIRRMKRCDIQGFTYSTYDSSLSQQQRRHKRRHAKPNRTKTNVKVNRSKSTFNYGFEIPKSWKNIIRIDGFARNNSWQVVEAGALVFHQCFDLKSRNYKPSKEYNMLYYI